jgi:hypothetical protein
LHSPRDNARNAFDWLIYSHIRKMFPIGCLFALPRDLQPQLMTWGVQIGVQIARPAWLWCLEQNLPNEAELYFQTPLNIIYIRAM